MCYNCGCMIPDDTMGHDDNITDHSFEELAKKLGKSTDETKQMVFEMLEKNEVTHPEVQSMFMRASQAWGQSVDEAKKNTHDLLKDTLEK